MWLAIVACMFDANRVYMIHSILLIVDHRSQGEVDRPLLLLKKNGLFHQPLS